MSFNMAEFRKQFEGTPYTPLEIDNFDNIVREMISITENVGPSESKRHRSIIDDIKSIKNLAMKVPPFYKMSGNYMSYLDLPEFTMIIERYYGKYNTFRDEYIIPLYVENAEYFIKQFSRGVFIQCDWSKIPREIIMPCVKQNKPIDDAINTIISQLGNEVSEYIKQHIITYDSNIKLCNETYDKYVKELKAHICSLQSEYKKKYTELNTQYINQCNELDKLKKNNELKITQMNLQIIKEYEQKILDDKKRIRQNYAYEIANYEISTKSKFQAIKREHSEVEDTLRKHSANLAAIRQQQQKEEEELIRSHQQRMRTLAEDHRMEAMRYNLKTLQRYQKEANALVEDPNYTYIVNTLMGKINELHATTQSIVRKHGQLVIQARDWNIRGLFNLSDRQLLMLDEMQQQLSWLPNMTQSLFILSQTPSAPPMTGNHDGSGTGSAAVAAAGSMASGDSISQWSLPPDYASVQQPSAPAYGDLDDDPNDKGNGKSTTAYYV